MLKLNDRVKIICGDHKGKVGKIVNITCYRDKWGNKFQLLSISCDDGVHKALDVRVVKK